MDDFIGRPLAVGDYVALMHPYYKSLLLARVDSFTASGNFCYVRWGDGDSATKRQQGNQLVKLDGPDLLLHILKR